MAPMDRYQSSDGPYCSFLPSLTAAELSKEIRRHLLRDLGRDPDRVSDREMYRAAAHVLRDYLIERWIATQQRYYTKHKKRLYYLSMEFLVGRSLGNTLINIGFFDLIDQALAELGYDLAAVREEEEDAALGNGGLGRLAACFLDSMATMGIPAYGYGIRYEYGLFYQRLVDGYQVESPDNWLRYGSPWEFERTSNLFTVHFYGKARTVTDADGRIRSEWVETAKVMAMACDFLVPGFDNDNVVNMRLWTARASREFDFFDFNRGDYIEAVEHKVRSETISKLLYPSDDISQGRELRLKQQYFFVAATFQDIFRRFTKSYKSFDGFSDAIAVQMNDTHPAIAIPELLRLLLDQEGLDWDTAWDICVKTFGYTNHTLMPEALETWPVDMIGRVLPRHLEIIYEINRRLLDEVARRYPGDMAKLQRMSLIEEGPVHRVRMANLAIVGSHSVNGVARLHTRLLRTRLFKDFDEFFPGRFNCKTNGITQRRWLLKCNPGLADLITDVIGGEWVIDLDHLARLHDMAGDAPLQRRWLEVKRHNKLRLAALIRTRCGLDADPDSLFDVQVKRIHEYKRQLLNILHVVHLYQRMLATPTASFVPRTVIFGGKAAPSYRKAKLIIKLINSVAEVINHDSRVRDRLKVVFIPNYGVSLAEKIIPAADLSEQISTAGTEASGTGNMKLALNGALTIGTLDGANIEIMEEVGAENMFIFGLTADQVEQVRLKPGRTPDEICIDHPDIGRVVAAIADGTFSHGDRNLFTPLLEAILAPNDPYLVLTDLADYLRCQAEVEQLFLNQEAWSRKSILNVAHMGRFSSDRAVREYAEEIWGIHV